MTDTYFPSKALLHSTLLLSAHVSLSFVMCSADWIQHVLDTDGEPYLQTPEDDIPVISLLLLDVLGFLLLAAMLPVALGLAVWKLLKRKQFAQKGKLE